MRRIVLNSKDPRWWSKGKWLFSRNPWIYSWTHFFPSGPDRVLFLWCWQCISSSLWGLSLIVQAFSFFFWGPWSRLQGRSWSKCSVIAIHWIGRITRRIRRICCRTMFWYLQLVAFLEGKRFCFWEWLSIIILFFEFIILINCQSDCLIINCENKVKKRIRFNLLIRYSI